MKKIILYCHNILIKNNKKQYFLLILMNFLTSISQAFGVVTLYPLVLLMTNPNTILMNKYYVQFFPYKSLSLEKQVLILSIFFLLFILTNIILNFSISVYQNYFVNNLVNKIKLNLYKSFLEVDLSKNKLVDKSAITNLLGSEVGKIQIFLDYYLRLITDFLLLLSLILILGAFNIYFLISIFIFGSIFYIIYSLSRSILYKNSILHSKVNQKIANSSWHITHAFQDIMLFGLKKKFLDDLDQLNLKFLKVKIKNIFFVGFPRYFVEILIFITLVLYLNLNLNFINFVEEIPKLTVTLYVLWRLFPILSSITRSFSLIKTNQYSFENFKKFLQFFSLNILVKNKDKKKFIFKKYLVFNNVSFKYQRLKKEFNFNFSVQKGKKIHIKGVSGSGKSTFFNLAAGLTLMKSGSIQVDGDNIHDNLNSYWNIIGYVSQKPYLIKDTVAWNITLKNSLTKNEKMKLKKIYNICGLSKVVPNYKSLFTTQIFTDALELSGGQKQRLQIARVLFKEPQILFLDESFNALDKNSENMILKKIKQNFKNLTILASSHRPIKNFFDSVINI